MKTGIKDKTGIEICVGDKVRKINRVDKNTKWVVTFRKIKAIINNTCKSIHTFVLVDEDGYEDIMESEIHWQYAEEDKTEYIIIN